MIFRTKILLDESVELQKDFVHRNEQVSKILANKYDERNRITALSKDQNELELMMFIDFQDYNHLDAKSFSQQYLQGMKYDGKIINSLEMTYEEYWNRIKRLLPDRMKPKNDYLSFFDDRTTWDDLVPYTRNCPVTEKIITAKAIMKHDRYMSTMTEEINRIKQNKNKSFIGHPVHYLIQSNHLKSATEVSYDLVRNMFKYKRIASLRVNQFMLDSTNLEDVLENLEKAVKISEGATLLFDLRQSAFENAVLRDINNFIDQFSELFKRSCHKTLYFFIYEEKVDPIISRFLENINSNNFIFIEPRLMNQTMAQNYLRRCAIEHNSNPKDFENLLCDSQSLYNESDLAEIFSRKYDNLIKNEYFPEYQDIKSTQFENVATAEGKAYVELRNLIGLEKIKELIDRFVSYQKTIPELNRMGFNLSTQNRHMIFTGNPGTAKTTVARLLGRIMKDNGLLSVGDFIEVGRSDIVGEYVGWTAVKVKRLFKRAKGSILFIDEAYSLVDESRNSFGAEALATIVQEMENSRSDIVVIFAGYPKEMNDFVSQNPGLKSRVSFFLDFDDYSIDDLEKIAISMFSEKGFHPNREFMDRFRDLCFESKSTINFGNGRFVRNFVEEVVLSHVDYISKHDLNRVSKEEVDSISLRDFPISFLGNEYRSEFMSKRIRFS